MNPESAKAIAETLNSSRSNIHHVAADLIRGYRQSSDKAAIVEHLVSELTFLVFLQGYQLTREVPLVRIREIERRDMVYLCPCQLGYPHPSIATRQRANKKGEAILYVCTSLDCAIEEKGGGKLSAFCTVDYELKAEAGIAFIPIGELDHLRRHGRMLLGNEEARAQAELIYGQLRNDVRLAAQLVDAFLAEQFMLPSSADSDVYHLTTALTNEILSSDKVGAILYPSVAHRGGFNLAIRPDVAQEKLRPSRFSAYAVRKYLGYGIAELEKYAEADSVDDRGDIRWMYSPFGNARMGIPPAISHSVCTGWAEL